MMHIQHMYVFVKENLTPIESITECAYSY